MRPCLSDSKRLEIQQYKVKALEIERRLAETNRHPPYTTSEEDRRDCEENSRKFLGEVDSGSVHSDNHTDHDVDNENFVTSISEWDISSIPGTDHEYCGLASLCSGATVTIDYQENVNDTAGQSNDTFVPQPTTTMIRSDSFIVDEPSECFLKQLEDNGVVPSNSTSLTDCSTKTELNQTKIFVKPVDRRKSETLKKMATPKAKKYTPKPFPFKKGRIPSDNISNLPDKLVRKCQNSNVNVVDIRRERQEKAASKQTARPNSQTRQLTSSSSVETSFTQTDINYDCCNDTSTVDERIAEIVSNVEEKFHNEIVFFLDKQKREQEAFLRKLMSQVKVKQDAFQCALVMQIKALIGESVSAFLNNQDNLTTGLHDRSNLMNDVNGNLSALEIKGGNDCRQTEVSFLLVVSFSHFGDFSWQFFTLALAVFSGDLTNQPRKIARALRKLFLTGRNSSQKIAAATKINAFVRGYLTRRLFKTEHVQELLKTIRDTLYLVIDLHFEDNDVDSVADIKMKHNLLQQLESNRYNLSHIFTQKTPAERMAMIAVDTQMMMHRLVQNNSKNKGPTNVNRSSSASVEDKLKKLKIIKL